MGNSVKAWDIPAVGGCNQPTLGCKGILCSHQPGLQFTCQIFPRFPCVARSVILSLCVFVWEHRYIKHYHTLSILYIDICSQYVFMSTWLAVLLQGQLVGKCLDDTCKQLSEYVSARRCIGCKQEPIFINDTYYWSFYRSKPYEIPLYDTIIWLGSTSINLSHYDNMNRMGFHEFVHSHFGGSEDVSSNMCLGGQISSAYSSAELDWERDESWHNRPTTNTS